MARWLKITLVLSAFLLLAAIPLAMQLETGSLEGSVTNDRGPVANASIEVRNVITGAIVYVESDAGGQYAVEQLRSGRYSLWVEARGHDSLWIPQIVVEGGQATRHDIRLERSRMGPAGL